MNINNLPQELLTKIISYLPCKQAIRTSLLSKRWRNLWRHSASICIQANNGKTVISHGQGLERGFRAEEIKTFHLRIDYVPKRDNDVMEENPHRVSRGNNGGTHCQNDAVDEENRRQRHYNHHIQDDEVKCSGKRCQSWAAAAIGDCVALCCCPCAIINLLTLTFVKVPWMIGRRCLRGCGMNKKKKRGLLRRRRCCAKINGEDHHHNNQHRRFETDEGDKIYGGGGGDSDDHRFVVERDGSLTKEEEEEVKTTSFGGDDESRISARVEAERVWLELYQIGHLGFGRVSFTGIQ